MKNPSVKCDNTFAKQHIRAFLWFLRKTLMTVMFAGALLVALGCGETSGQPDLKSVADADIVESPASKNEVHHVQGTTEEPITSESQDSDNGVLQTAGELFQKAQSKGGSTAAGASRWVKDKLGNATTASEKTAEESWKWANDTFESLKSQGLTTANSTSEWLGQDWNNMDSWQYKIATLTGTEQELASQLNELGRQGWECFNTEQHADGTRFFFKKPSFSYLRNLPFNDFIKLVPLMKYGDK